MSNTQTVQNSLIFIDARVADYQTLIAGLPADSEVILINGGNGLQQMADALAGRSGMDAIHVFSHGSAGALQLGDTLLNSDTLNTYAPLLGQIGQSLTAEGDLLLYGCNVAQGEAGQAFVESIARVTQADVAASDDLTGASDKGGDWVLEVVQGDIETPVAIDATAQQNYAELLATTIGNFSGFTYYGTGMGVGWGQGFTTVAGSLQSIKVVADTDITYTLYLYDAYTDSMTVPGATAPIHTQTGTMTAGADTTIVINAPVVTYAGAFMAFYIKASAPTATFSMRRTYDATEVTAYPGVSNQMYSGDNALDINPATAPWSTVSDLQFEVTIGPAPNAAPTVGGITTTTTIDDTATTTPFSGVTIADAESNNVSVIVTLDTQAKGALSTLGSFTDNGNGSYTLASTTAATAQTAIRQLVFNPTDNRVAPGSTETTTFTIAVNDGTNTTTNATTTVTSTSVNDAPTIANLAGDSVTWVDTTTALTLDVGANAIIADADKAALNGGLGNWSGASLTVSRTTPLATDTYGFDTTTGVASFTDTGAALQSGGSTFATYTKTGGTLAITFTSGATTALVQDVVHRITYLNATPPGDSTLRFTLSDGLASTTADVSVPSDTIYVTTNTDTTTINYAPTTAFSEAVGIAAADTTGTQTIVFGNGQITTLAATLTIAENLNVMLWGASGGWLQAGAPAKTLTVSNGVDLTFTGTPLKLDAPLAGSGNLVFNLNTNETATLTPAAGANSGFTGTITHRTGHLEASTNDAFGNATLVANATLNGGQLRGIATTLANPIKFFDASSYLNVGIASLTLSGTVDLNGGTGHVYNANSQSVVTLGGVISNGNLSVEAGNWNLTKTNTYSGTTTITGQNGGAKLSVDGALANGNVSVINSGTLMGTGTIGGAVSVSGTGSSISGGSLASSQIGQLTLNGGLTVASSGVIDAKVASTTVGSYDQLVVYGTVNVTGGVLALAASGYTAAAGDSLMLINNDGSDLITGTMTLSGSGALAEGATFSFGGRTFSISYQGGDGNDLVISSNAAPSFTPPTAIALTDTTAVDTFSNTTGTLAATDTDGIASYGIDTPTSSAANFVDNGITYDISKTGTYGTLYVESSTGKYAFVPNATAINAVAGAATPSETFTVTATDSNASPLTGNATLAVNVTGANDAPTDIALSASTVSTYEAANATVGTLSGTDVDAGGPTYSIVSVNGDTSSTLFNLSGTSLRATASSTTTPGTYAVVVRVNDGTTDFDKSLSVTVSDALVVTTNLDSNADATTGTSYSAELADGGGLSLREALALASAGGKTIGFAAGLSGQTISIGSSLAIPSGTTIDSDATSTLTFAGGSPNTLTVSGTGVTFNSGTGDLLTLGPLNISGTGSFIKTGAGTVAFGFDTNSHAGGFTGAYQIDGGTLKLNKSGSLSTSSSLLVNSGGTLDLNSWNQTFANISGSGTITSSTATGWATLIANVASGTQIFSGVISGSQVSLTKQGAGTLQLTGASSNTFTAEFNVYDGLVELNKSGGAFAMGSGGAARLVVGDGAGAADSAVVRWMSSNQLPSNTHFDGIQSDGLLDLNGYNQTFSGLNELKGGGEIRTGTGTLTLSSATLRQNSTTPIDINGNLSLTGTNSVYVTGGDLAIAAAIGGTGNLNLAAGAYTLALNGAASYSGTTTVATGTTLSIAGDSNVGSGSLNLSGGTLTVTGANGTTIDNAIALTSTSTVSDANALTLSGAISGTGSITKAGAGTLTVSNTNTYSGTTTVSAGTLLVDGVNSGTGAVTVNSGAKLGGVGSLAGAVTVLSGGTLDAATTATTESLATGNLVVNGTLSAEISGTSAGAASNGYDQIITTGSVNVTGATLSVTGSYSAVLGDVFVLVNNDSTDLVTGTFTGLAEGATVTVNSVPMMLSYVGGTGNDITLTAMLSFSNLSLSADTGTSTTDFITKTASQTVSATLSSALGSTGVTIWGSVDNANTWTNVTSMVSGTTLTWTPVTLGSSNMTLQLEARNASSVVVGTTSQAYELDTTGPATTVATMVFSADTAGASTTDFITKTAAQTISGTLSAVTANGEKVQVSLDNGSTWVDATNTVGQNTWTTSQTLTASNTLQVRVVDLAGNPGTVASQAYVLDQTAPTISFSAIDISADTGTSDADFTTNTASQTITATLSGAPAGTDKVFGSIDNGSNWIDITSMVAVTTLTWTGVTLGSSNMTLKLKVSDNAGNDGAIASQAYVLDTAVPTVSVTTANVAIGTNVSTSQSSETGLVYLIPSGQTPADYAALEALVSGGTATKATVTPGGSNTPIATTGLTAGTYKVYAVDAAGNISTASANTITLGTPPSITGSAVTFSADTGTSSTDLITRTAAQTISGALTGVTATGDTVQVSLDNGSTWATATNTIGQSSWSLAGQTLTGSNTLQVRVSNGGFDGTAYSTAYVLDTTAPTTTVSTTLFSADTGTSSTDLITNTAAQTVSGTLSTNLVTGEIVQVSLDNGVNWVTASSSVGTSTWSLAGQALSGSGTLKVRVTDAAGNTGTEASHTFVLDTTAPTTTVSTTLFSADTGTSSTDLITNTAAQTVSGTLSTNLVTGEIVQVSLDNGVNWVTASSSVGTSTWSLAGQTLSGSGTLKVRVTDAAGNTGTEASHTFVLDTGAPLTTVTSIALSPDTGTSSTDFSTNTAAQTVSGTLSAVMASGDIVQVSLDNGATWATASSTVGQDTWSLGGQILSASNTIKVRVTDAAGNPGAEASQAYVLDTAVPTASVTTANVAIGTNVTTSQSTETGLVYLIPSGQTPADYAALEALVSGGTATKATVTTGGSNTPIATTGLTAGTYKVWSVDAAGNISAASANTITLGTPPTTTVSAATFSADTGISSTDFITQTASQTISGTLSAVTVTGETVEVSLDNGTNWVSATNTLGQTSWSLAGQTISGSNTLQVRVISAGFASTPYSHSYTLDTAAPSAPSAPDMTVGTDSGTSSTDNITGDNTPTYSGTAEANATVKLYDTDGITLLGTATADGTGNWTITSSALGEGSHTLTTKATDAAGNTSGASTGLSVTIDSTAPSTTIATIALNADTGSSTADFITQTAAQDINGTLSANMVSGDIVQVSLDNGSTWATATTSVGANTWSLTGQTLVGSNTIKVRVTDEAGNSGTVATQAYVLDTTAPVFNPSTSAPADNAASASRTADLVVRFSEAISSTSDLSKVYLKTAPGGVTVQATVTIDANGNLVINPATDLDYSSNYVVNWDANALLDAAGNMMTAQGDQTTYNFTTEAVPAPDPTPVITIINPNGGTTVVSTSPGGNTTVPTPATGSTVTANGSGTTTVTNPGSTVTLNNTGTGTVTTTGITGSTTLAVTGTGPQTADLTGMKPGDTLTINNTGTGTVDLSNLPDGVKVVLLGTGPVTLNDSDGATPSIENKAPALVGGTVGDGNGDGTPDSLQSNVASVSFLKTDTAQTNPASAPPVFVSLIADSKDGKIDTTDTGSATLENVKQLDAPANLPSAVKMPLGQISFDAKVSTAGMTETFSLYVDPTLGINAYWKQTAAGKWINLASSEYGGQVVTEDGKTRLDFKITDGGQFDSDGKADGIITDPGAPGIEKDSDHDQFPDALEAANGLTVGVKDNDVFTSSKFFVMQLYRDILYREAEPGGLQYWQNQMDTGALTRPQVASAFLASAEFVAGTGGVARLYFGALQRLPDAAGMDFWMQQEQSGTTLNQIASAFTASKEFTDIYGSLSNTAFVDKLYLNMQGKAPTVAQESIWVSQLTSGVSRSTVLLGFTDSAEYTAASKTKLSVALDYLGLLGRPAEQAGFDWWVEQQDTNIPEVEVIGGFIVSTEYHGRFLP